jgi:glycosyltransferase domain-containing protein
MKKISVIIPTCNRPEYLRRILSYFSEYGEDWNVIVADASSDKNRKRNKEIIFSFSNLNITQLSDHPSELRDLDVYYAIKDVKEKYCVLCADDDFITTNGINQSIDFLERNPDFTVAHGYYITFWLKTDNKGKRKFYWAPRYIHESITFPDAKSRLTFQLSHIIPYLPTLYGVHRTDFLNMIFKENMKFTNDTLFGELLPSVLTLIYGKMKHLDVLYAAREAAPKNVSHPGIKDFINAGTYDEKYAKFKDCLAMHLSKKSELDVEEAKRVVDSAMSVYLSTHLEKSARVRMKDTLGYSRLSDWLPLSIDKEIRKLHRKVFLPKGMNNFPSVDVPSSKYYDDFNKIRHHVLFYSRR